MGMSAAGAAALQSGINFVSNVAGSTVGGLLD